MTVAMPKYSLPPDDLELASTVSFHPDSIARPVVAFGGEMITRGMDLGTHSHRKAQLILTLRGVVTCEADQGVWIVPPLSAIWIPGGLAHAITLSGEVEVYCLFVDPGAVPELPGSCSTLAISAFFKHLVMQISALPLHYDMDGPAGRLVAVLLDQLVAAPAENLHFPTPSNRNLRSVADALIANPSDRATIEEWGRRVGMAPRTLTRLLKRETGMSFGAWRQQLHILIALQRLGQGQSVQDVSLALGYESTSAFVTMFRKAMGKPPARYLAERALGGDAG